MAYWNLGQKRKNRRNSGENGKEAKLSLQPVLLLLF